MMTLLHSHVTASGDVPTDVRERIEYSIILTCASPRNSLLKIKKMAFLHKFPPFNGFNCANYLLQMRLRSNPGDAQGIQDLGNQGG